MTELKHLTAKEREIQRLAEGARYENAGELLRPLCQGVDTLLQTINDLRGRLEWAESVASEYGGDERLLEYEGETKDE